LGARGCSTRCRSTPIIIRYPRASAVWKCQESRVTDRASLTERSVTRATGNKIDADKHRLIHIRAPTLFKRRCQHRPTTDTESTTTSHAYTSASSSRARTRGSSHTDTTTPMHKLRITHIIIFSHTHSVTDKVKHTHSHSHTRLRTLILFLAAPVPRSFLVDRTLAGGEGRKRQLHSARRQTTVPRDVGYPRPSLAQEPAFTIETTTGLQGTGPAASAPHTRTHARGLCVCLCLYQCLRLYVMQWKWQSSPDALGAIPGAASNVMHVCSTHLTLPSNVCISPPRHASTPRAYAHTLTIPHILSTWGTRTKAQPT
jgi:hypothetical protein